MTKCGTWSTSCKRFNSFSNSRGEDLRGKEVSDRVGEFWAAAQIASVAENQSTTNGTKAYEGQFRRFPSCNFVPFVVDWFRN